MRYFNYIIIFCASLLAGAGLRAQPVQVDKVVAVVGDNIILRSEVEAQFQQLAADNQGELPENAKCNIFDNLLLDKLFLAQAQIDSITVQPEEVDAELERRIRYFISVFGSREKLEEYYGKPVVELKDDFRDDIEKQLLSDKMKGKAFSGLKVSPAEVKDFFERIPKDSVPFFNSELELGQIVILAKVSEEEKERARKQLNNVRMEIIQGADFGVKAIQVSDDRGTKLDGGSLGWIERGEMVPEFEAIAYRLKEGEVSEVFETPFGFHIALVDEIRGEKRRVSHILVRPILTRTDLRIAGEKLDSVLHQLQVDSLTWRDAVSKFSDDEQSKSIGGMMTNAKNGTAFFEKPDIDGTLAATIDMMKVGEYSGVLPYAAPDRTGDTKQGFRIIWLKSETKPHKANLDLDYPKIQTAARAEKQQKALDNWIKLHRAKNYVRIDDSMKSCPQVSKWIN